MLWRTQPLGQNGVLLSVVGVRGKVLAEVIDEAASNFPRTSALPGDILAVSRLITGRPYMQRVCNPSGPISVTHSLPWARWSLRMAIERRRSAMALRNLSTSPGVSLLLKRSRWLATFFME